MAASCGHTKAVDLLLKAGADRHQTATAAHAGSGIAEGSTPLSVAIANGHMQIASLLQQNFDGGEGGANKTAGESTEL